MRLILFIFLILGICAKSQNSDKVFLKNGDVKKGMVISVVNDYVFFKASDTSFTQRLAKPDILLIEKYDGKIMIFASKKNRKDTGETAHIKLYRHSVGAQPFNVLLGRMTASYEYLNKSGSVGFVLPVSVTFDPVGVIYQATSDTSGARNDHTPGFNLISGADVNFYLGKGDFEGFYFGPRIRYGIDMFLSNIEGYSVQTQFGYRINEPGERLVQHISVGLGFVRILASPAGNRISPKRSYGWASINYRIGFNW